ncbi:hypothetical protein Tco_0761251 [Tanacetum coccineum]
MGVRAFEASSHGAFLLGFYFMRLAAISIVKGYDNLKAFEKAEIIRSLAWQLIAFAAMAEASFPCRMHPPSIIILFEHIVHGYRPELVRFLPWLAYSHMSNFRRRSSVVTPVFWYGSRRVGLRLQPRRLFDVVPTLSGELPKITAISVRLK